MIDREGYRSNVGIIIFNARGQLLWARRIGENSWQFPQGGIKPQETPEQALFRELDEEVGLQSQDVELVASTQDWLRYELPHRMRRQSDDREISFVGQKQRWFLLRLLSSEKRVSLDNTASPEFDYWRWVPPQVTLEEVVDFKRHVYEQALEELIPMMEGQISASVG